MGEKSRKDKYDNKYEFWHSVHSVLCEKDDSQTKLLP